MTTTKELLERFDKLAARAEADDDVAGELRVLAYELEKASASATSAEDARKLLGLVDDARSYADRIDRWRDNVRKKERADDEGQRD